MEELKQKIDNIEYKDIKELRTELEEVKIDLAKNNLLTEQNTNAMNNMSKTMNSVRDTMIQMSSAIECISRTNKELAINVGNQNEKIDRLQERQDIYDTNLEKMREDIEANEDKGKFDIILFLKNNWVSIVISAGLLVYLFLK